MRLFLLVLSAAVILRWQRGFIYLCVVLLCFM